MKKILGLVAVALISASLITGCGNDKNDSMADTTSQTSQTSNTQETSKSMTESGEVSDSDGFIGNEENETGNSGSDIMDDIEKKILYNKLANTYDDIKRYVIDNYME